MHAGIEQRHQQLHQRRTAAAEALGQHIGAQQQHGARLGLGERLAHSAGVAAHQVSLQLRQTFRRNAHVRQLAEAGVDPVDLLPGRHNLFNQLPTGGYAGKSGRRYRSPGAAEERNSFDLGQGQWLAAQNQAIHRPES